MPNFSVRALSWCILVGLAGAAVSAPKSTTPGNRSSGAAVFVNGEPVHRYSLDLMLKKQERLGVPADSGLMQQVQDELVVQTILAQQAVKKRLDADPQVAAQIDLNRLSVLSSAYLTEYFKAHPVADEMVSSEYERRRAAGEIMEYRVRHISVPTEDEARELLKKLVAGEEMAKLAKSRSTDPGANDNGGDIGWFRPDVFIDEQFAQAVAGLKKGETTRKPVRSRWGWQIIRVEDGPRPVKDLPAFGKLDKDMRDVMRQKTMKKKLDELLTALKAKSTITHDVALQRDRQ